MTNQFHYTLLDEIRAKVPLSQVVARKVDLRACGRELKGHSPFRTERTPSFVVNDHNGFYRCFASGEHGDIFTFVMKTEGVTFAEAVQRLAQEAGVDVKAHMGNVIDLKQAEDAARNAYYDFVIDLSQRGFCECNDGCERSATGEDRIRLDRLRQQWERFQRRPDDLPF
jgi:DNA primase